jgi:hypothetical protein
VAASKNLLNRFLKDSSKTAELECFLTNSGASSQTEKNKVNYGHLEVEYKKDGREIKTIKSTEPHCQNILDGLERGINDAIYTDHGKAVGEAYVANIRYVRSM